MAFKSVCPHHQQKTEYNAFAKETGIKAGVRLSDYSRVDAVADYVLDDMARSNRRFQREKYRGVITIILANLVRIYRCSSDQRRLCLEFSRNNSQVTGLGISSPTLVALMDRLEDLGIVRQIQHPFRSAGERTRVTYTPTFIELLTADNIQPPGLVYRIPKRPLVLRDANKNDIVFDPTEQTQAMVDALNSINRLYLKTCFALDGAHMPPPFVRRIFNRGSFNCGGRFQAHHQWLSKHERSLITINGKETVELDISSTQIKIAYWLAGAEFPGNGDFYAVPGYEADRPLVKALVSAAFNARGMNGVIMHFLKRRFRREGEFLDYRRMTYDELKRMFQAILAFHAPLTPFFFGGQGLRLQYFESDFAQEILLHFTERGIPVLGVHESFIIDRGHEELLRVEVERRFKDRFGIEAKLKKVG